MEVSLYATLTFKICHNHIHLYRNHPSPPTATCTPKKTYRTHSPKLRLLLVVVLTNLNLNDGYDERSPIPKKISWSINPRNFGNHVTVRPSVYLVWKPVTCVYFDNRHPHIITLLTAFKNGIHGPEHDGHLNMILSHDQKAQIPWDSTALAQDIARFALNE